ncbi:MAG TPA: sugar phosphate isomerase/epimerase family protein, partial [Spirochaetia bacterium]|nr:sugar phosphate isomerase/epimerase family protein [Spirochaetia bacterium]
MSIQDAFQPALLVSEIYALLLEDYRGNTDELMVDTIERVSEEGFFRGAALLPVVSAGQRSRLARILERTGLSLTVWFNPLIAAEGLNLSSLDEGLRKRSVQRLKECFEQAVETGAEFLGLCSGPDPKPGSAEIRAEATARFQESLLELCQAAQGHSRTVILEPLDRGAHKDGLIGPVSEAAPLVERVRSSFSNVTLCWDSAHTVLCGEDLLDSLELAAGTTAQIHLASAVLDRGKPGFGDHHMLPGPPGCLDVETAARIFERAVQ